ncbi:hypothetical protein PoB_002747200 [Plakobranchus ocellatus]|uniref:Uncharacterized protein n=1 Tax=Plakobranchus ocellatus TaxID=259542 RepID=A0AAV4A0Z6_9GAST|nr:hypothetical protein PoB_002747200 [Plakobranchus ocellatus]
MTLVIWTRFQMQCINDSTKKHHATCSLQKRRPLTGGTFHQPSSLCGRKKLFPGVQRYLHRVRLQTQKKSIGMRQSPQNLSILHSGKILAKFLLNRVIPQLQHVLLSKARFNAVQLT